MRRQLNKVWAEASWVDFFLLVQVLVASVCCLAVLARQEMSLYLRWSCSAQIARERGAGARQHFVDAQALCSQNEFPAISPELPETAGNAGKHQHEGDNDDCCPYSHGKWLEIQVVHLVNLFNVARKNQE